jgi:hypothetical protein
MRPLWAEMALRIVRGVAVGTVAAVALLVVAGAVDHGLHEPDGQDGLPPRPGEGAGEGGLAIELGHFEAGMNWLTFLGGFLAGASTPSCTRARWTTLMSRVAAPLGAGLLTFMLFYAFDDRDHWDGVGDPNLRPWITIGLAACASLAVAIRPMLAHGRQPETGGPA